jgi:hypothetical protein
MTFQKLLQRFSLLRNEMGQAGFLETVLTCVRRRVRVCMCVRVGVGVGVGA